MPCLDTPGDHRRPQRLSAVCGWLVVAASLAGCAAPPLTGTAYTVVLRPELLPRTAPGQRADDWTLALRDGPASAARRGPVVARAQVGSDGSLRFALPVDLPAGRTLDAATPACLWIVNRVAAVPLRPGPDTTGFRHPRWEQLLRVSSEIRAARGQREAAATALQQAQRQAQEAESDLQPFALGADAVCRLPDTAAPPPRPAAAVDAPQQAAMAAGLCAAAWVAALGEQHASLLHRAAGRAAAQPAATGPWPDLAAGSLVLSGPQLSLLVAYAQAGDSFVQRDEALRSFAELDDGCQRSASRQMATALAGWNRAVADAAERPRRELARCEAAVALAGQRRAAVTTATANLTTATLAQQQAEQRRPDDQAPPDDLRPLACL